ELAHYAYGLVGISRATLFLMKQQGDLSKEEYDTHKPTQTVDLILEALKEDTQLTEEQVRILKETIQPLDKFIEDKRSARDARAALQPEEVVHQLATEIIPQKPLPENLEKVDIKIVQIGQGRPLQLDLRTLDNKILKRIFDLDATRAPEIYITAPNGKLVRIGAAEARSLLRLGVAALENLSPIEGEVLALQISRDPSKHKPGTDVIKGVFYPLNQRLQSEAGIRLSDHSLRKITIDDHYRYIFPENLGMVLTEEQRQIVKKGFQTREVAENLGEKIIHTGKERPLQISLEGVDITELLTNPFYSPQVNLITTDGTQIDLSPKEVKVLLRLAIADISQEELHKEDLARFAYKNSVRGDYKNQQLYDTFHLLKGKLKENGLELGKHLKGQRTDRSYQLPDNIGLQMSGEQFEIATQLIKNDLQVKQDLGKKGLQSSEEAAPLLEFKGIQYKGITVEEAKTLSNKGIRRLGEGRFTITFDPDFNPLTLFQAENPHIDMIPVQMNKETYYISDNSARTLFKIMMSRSEGVDNRNILQSLLPKGKSPEKTNSLLGYATNPLKIEISKAYGLNKKVLLRFQKMRDERTIYSADSQLQIIWGEVDSSASETEKQFNIHAMAILAQRLSLWGGVNFDTLHPEVQAMLTEGKTPTLATDLHKSIIDRAFINIQGKSLEQVEKIHYDLYEEALGWIDNLKAGELERIQDSDIQQLVVFYLQKSALWDRIFDSVQKGGLEHIPYDNGAGSMGAITIIKDLSDVENIRERPGRARRTPDDWTAEELALLSTEPLPARKSIVEKAPPNAEKSPNVVVTADEGTILAYALASFPDRLHEAGITFPEEVVRDFIQQTEGNLREMSRKKRDRELSGILPRVIRKLEVVLKSGASQHLPESAQWLALLNTEEVERLSNALEGINVMWMDKDQRGLVFGIQADESNDRIVMRLAEGESAERTVEKGLNRIAELLLSAENLSSDGVISILQLQELQGNLTPAIIRNKLEKVMFAEDTIDGKDVYSIVESVVGACFMIAATGRGGYDRRSTRTLRQIITDVYNNILEERQKTKNAELSLK
ncbi:MAG: hypothetical protein Q7S61_01210, partial [bacterium]|nr:hypothetical protein [bacterium]